MAITDEQPMPRSTEEIAGELAEAIYWNRSEDVTGRIRDLFVEFANEIQRRSIEP